MRLQEAGTSEALHGSMEKQLRFTCLQEVTTARIKDLDALRDTLKDYVSRLATRRSGRSGRKRWSFAADLGVRQTRSGVAGGERCSLA